MEPKAREPVRDPPSPSSERSARDSPRKNRRLAARPRVPLGRAWLAGVPRSSGAVEIWLRAHAQCTPAPRRSSKLTVVYLGVSLAWACCRECVCKARPSNSLLLSHQGGCPNFASCLPDQRLKSIAERLKLKLEASRLRSTDTAR